MSAREPSSGISGWEGTGECVVGLAGERGRLAATPPPLRRIRGPVLVVAARYATSPVGPYLELAVAEPVRLGRHLGTWASVIVVDSAGSSDAGRTRWGLGKEMGTLHWSREGDDVLLRWEERCLVVRGHPLGARFPALVPFRSLEVRDGRPVRFGGRVTGEGRFCAVEVSAPPDDPLAVLAGGHRGLSIRQGKVIMGEAKLLGAPGGTR